jgi:tetratricopeptide (TPR) repeat protein
MSLASERSIEIFELGDVRRAFEVAISAAENDPSDWHCHFAVGRCLRQMDRFSEAIVEYELALSLDRFHPEVLLALSIARQLNNQLEESIEAAKSAIELDPDYYNAFNTLGMTRKLQGEFEKASLNYEAGAKTLVRCIVKRLINERSSKVLPYRMTTYNLWTDYVLEGAYFSGATADVDKVVFPSGNFAEQEERTQGHGGLFWVDTHNEDGAKVRMFLPNFFNTMFEELRRDFAFSNFLGNRSTVLRLMGQKEEADKHLQEAQELSSS